MRRSSVVLGLLVGVGLVLGGGLACEIDGSIGRDSAAGTGATDGVGTQSASGQSTDGPADGTAEAGSATSVGGGSGGGTGGESGETEGQTDLPAICHPTPDDEPCTRCRKESCCPFYEACLNHDSCLCWWDCLVTDHTPAQCLEQCQTDGVLYEELQICVAQHCDSCPAPMDTGM